MTQPRHDIDLAHETIRSERRGEFRTKHLDRDFALMLDVLAEVDGGHPALTQLTLDGVATFEGGVQADDGIGHGRILNRPGFAGDSIT